MKYNYVNIGERIKAERKRHHWTQEMLIEILNHQQNCAVGRNTLSAIENGSPTTCSLELLASLCDLFNCEIGYLLCEDGYEQKTRKDTDVYKETGLSYEAIKALQHISEPKLRHILDRILVDESFPVILNDIQIASECRQSRARKIRSDWNGDLTNLYDSLPEEETSYDDLVSSFADYSDKYAIVERSKLSPMYIQEASRIMGNIADIVVKELTKEKRTM